jgi:hypothetical protein
MTGKCCIGQDVRGMCFLSIPFDEMTADDILRVRACKHTPYAIAWWVYNSHWHELQRDPWFWQKNKYIQLITCSDVSNDDNYISKVNQMDSDIYDCIADLEWDDRYDEEETDEEETVALAYGGPIKIKVG